ncbi:vacuolar ATPase assembly integral membrane protein VMA21 isoform 2-T2 [Hipposideros larvatus]
MERLDKAALNALQPPDVRICCRCGVNSLRTGTRPSPSPCHLQGLRRRSLKSVCSEPSCHLLATQRQLSSVRESNRQPCCSELALLSELLTKNESSLASTLKTLLFFTALMITVPIGLYFTTKSYVFEGAFGMSTRDSYFYAAIVAVVAVHVVLALFVYVAWNEGSRQWREGKQD